MLAPIFIALLLFAASSEAQFAGADVREVGSGAEFVSALGSGRTLRLTATRIELPAKGDGVTVIGHRNLRILGAPNGGTEVVGVAGGTVLGFTNCHNIDLRRLTIRMESSATNAVLAFLNTTNVLLRDCRISGVAATGIYLRDTARMKMEACAVFNCGDGILRADDSRNVLVERCRFTRNEGSRGFMLRRFHDLRLERCEFIENTFKTELVGVVPGGAIVFQNCRFTDDRYPQTASEGAGVRVRSTVDGR